MLHHSHKQIRCLYCIILLVQQWQRYAVIVLSATTIAADCPGLRIRYSHLVAPVTWSEIISLVVPGPCTHSALGFPHLSVVFYFSKYCNITPAVAFWVGMVYFWGWTDTLLVTVGALPTLPTPKYVYVCILLEDCYYHLPFHPIPDFKDLVHPGSASLCVQYSNAPIQMFEII